MRSLAIPSAVTPAIPDANPGSAPANHGQRFDDTLRESQSAAKPHEDEHTANHDAAARTHGQHDDSTAKHDDKHDDKHSGDDTDTAPATATAAMIAPMAVRQAPAASGKPLPAADGKPARVATPTGVTQNIAASIQLPTATAAIQSNVLAAPPPTPPAASPAQLPGLPMLQTPASLLHPTESAFVRAPGSATATSDSSGSDASAPTATAPALSDDQAADASLSTNLQLLAKDADARSGNDAQDAALHAGPNGFMAHLAQLAGAHAGTASAPPPPAPPPAQLNMQASPGQPQFAPETAQHVAWMAGQGIQRAEIQLNPRKLGPIHVAITTHHDRVDVSFAVQHPQTVHALQQTLPQLHDMLAQQGLNLGQASVGQQAPGQQQHAAFAHAIGGRTGDVGGIDEIEAAPAWRGMRMADPGRVDDFA